ncbi:hypothetical protein ABEP00_17080 [Heyndrickxia sporothermodurans]|uniref:hypothetical protein n=1 Tax=Heyndrickxia sporothermodurans TaxID=46224 RepID=UPI00071752EF
MEEIQTEDNIVKTVTKKKKSKKKLFISLVIIIALLGAGAYSYFNFFTEEAQAKRVLNNYLNAMKKGKETGKYKTAEVDDFINLLDYEYQRTISRKQKDALLTLDEDFYNSPYLDYKDEFFNYDEFKEAQKVTFSKNEIVEESDDSITFKTGKYIEYRFLYKVEVTNKLGQKLYNKYYFVVNNDNGDKKFQVAESVEY